jgi:hypothetical protein
MTAPFQLPVAWSDYGRSTYTLRAADEEFLAEVAGGKPVEREYIARAINNHDALVELLTAAQWHVTDNDLDTLITAALEQAPVAPIFTECSICNEPQILTPSGVTCKNGHGGADSA